jgi:hypothetical protein
VERSTENNEDPGFSTDPEPKHQGIPLSGFHVQYTALVDRPSVSSRDTDVMLKKILS